MAKGDKMKKISFLGLALICAFMFSACTGDENSKNKTIIWRLASNQPKDHPQLKAVQELSDKFYEATGGIYRIEISPNELLGTQKDAFELLQSNIIQMAVVANTVLENVNSDFGILALPGIYNSITHQEKVYTSNLLDDLFSSAKSKKFIVLRAFTSAARNIYTDKPVRNPQDLKGYKIRVMESPVMISIINAMGATATPLSTYETYTAIQQGIINGAENNEVSYVDYRHYELVKYYSYTKHLMVPDELVINTDAYNSLSPEHKTIFDNLVKETVKREFELFAEQTNLTIEIAKKAGAIFIEDVNIEAFRKNFEPIIDTFISKNETRKKLYAQIKQLDK
jgi:tripartite ATP-independent transporter DctP family solute receptor